MALLPKDIARLLAAQLSGELTAAEAETLASWTRQSRKHRAVAEELGDDEQLRQLVERRAQDAQEDVQNRLFAHIQSLIAADNNTIVRPVHRVHFFRRGWFKYAAAVALFLVGFSVYYFVFHTSRPGPEMAKTVPSPTPGDILPGYDRAVLTLSDGQRVALDSAGAATIHDGKLSIEKKQGQLIYDNAGIVVMNTMTTPKGGQYSITLSDGTKVWLNAASSITYPTAFVGQQRSVRVTGEVYFEVTKNARQPFVVETGSDAITVLGTSFNVNAYADEGPVRTSLVEGTVQVRGRDGTAQVLHPGQAYRDGKVTATNTAQDIAWKNGVFNFDNVDVPTMMRQLARWYDIDVQYAGGVPGKRIEGKFSRSLHFAGVRRLLDQLGLRNDFHDRTLTIYNATP